MTQVAPDVNGARVWVQLEWEQVDAMIVKELKWHIEDAARNMKAAKTGEGWVHPDDVEYNFKLLPALLVVYEHWAGEDEANKLKEEINADEIMRSAE
jgi:hypothetical protein